MADEKVKVAEPISAPLKDKFFDTTGYATGFPMTPKRTRAVVLSILLLTIFSMIGPAIGLTKPNAGLALGLIAGIIAIYVSNQFLLHWAGWLLAVGGVLLNLFTINEVMTSFGNSQFLMMMGMFTVAEGATNTNMGKRIAYYMLYKFSNSQRMLVCGIFGAVSILSVFCSNLASTVVIAGISVGILKEIEATDPENGKRLGKVIMLIIPTGAMLGGMFFISSSPGMNTLGVQILASANKGVTLTYAQWAVFGAPCGLICFVPVLWIYLKCIKIPKGGINVDPNIFKKRYQDLGGIGGAEIRWIITIVGMVVVMIMGWMPTNTGGLAFGMLAMLPLVGSVNPYKLFQTLPFGQLLQMGFAGLMALLFSKYAIDSWFAHMLAPTLGGLPAILLIFVCGSILMVMNSIFPGATNGIIAMCITIFVPTVTALHLNPVVILVPTLFMGAFSNVLGVQGNMYLTYRYGYWDMKDPIVPGILSNIFVLIVTTLVTWFLYPLAGLSLYLK